MFGGGIRIDDLNFRKGTILYDRNVYLTESLWTEEAYDDAMRRAWERSFAFDAPFLETSPDEFVLECADCEMTTDWSDDLAPIPIDEAPPEEAIEAVPTPTDPPKPNGTRPDNKTAILPLAPETGGLQYDEPISLPQSPRLLPDEPLAPPAPAPAGGVPLPKTVPASEAAALPATVPSLNQAPPTQFASQPALVSEINEVAEAPLRAADPEFQAPISIDAPIPQQDAFLPPILPEKSRSALLNSSRGAAARQGTNRPVNGIKQTGGSDSPADGVKSADFQQPVDRSSSQVSPGPIFGWDKLFDR